MDKEEYMGWMAVFVILGIGYCIGYLVGVSI